MIYRGSYLVSMDAPPIEGGCLRVLNGRIAEVGTIKSIRPKKNEAIREFSDSVILPGLINSHCHLELGMARSMLPRGEPFPLWVSRLRKALDGSTENHYRQAARLGILECLKNGTTTVVDVGNTGEALSELASLPIRSYPYIEVLGLDPNQAATRLQAAKNTLRQSPTAHEKYFPGITSHASYSGSIDLMRSIVQDPTLRLGPYTLHVAESAEEAEMFSEGRGALFDFCKRIFPELKWERHMSPIRYLDHNNLIPKNSLFVHCNYLDDEDIRILASHEVSIVHCPLSKAFFAHKGFNPLALKSAGINLCLGTDSLASNDGLNLFDEMAEMHRNYPTIPCDEILAMATLNGASTLNRSGSLGILKPGAEADFIVIHLRHDQNQNLFKEIVSEAHEVLFVSVAGEEVVS